MGTDENGSVKCVEILSYLRKLDFTDIRAWGLSTVLCRSRGSIRVINNVAVFILETAGMVWTTFGSSTISCVTLS